MSRLTSFEFILKIIERAKDMEAGISEEEREKINHRLSVNKLQEHFKGRSFDMKKLKLEDTFAYY